MEPNQSASQTALAVAYMRAAHQLLDGEPRVLEDPVAVALLGPEAPAQIQAQVDRYQRPFGKALRAHVVLRSRFTEDRLAGAVQRGVHQYVLLGAGLDTFSLRQPAWARALRIFEVDHPATQAFKRERIETAGLSVPDNVSFLSVDFERESLLEGLVRQGVAVDELTFFSWLGVSMYLRESAIDAALKSVRGFPEGSEIVLTFAQRPEDRDDPTQEMALRAAEMGEPFISYFTPVAMESKLRRIGFGTVEFLSPRESEIRYFSQRPADLPVPSRTSIVAATV